LGINGKVVECFSRNNGQKFALKVSVRLSYWDVFFLLHFDNSGQGHV
jgi:hypothetical protein